jgi:hypothetical protein
MNRNEERNIIIKGISYLDSIIELYTQTDDMLNSHCRELVERRENLIQCLLLTHKSKQDTGHRRRAADRVSS